jgi:CRP/FNR family cyclic AMP-dependent transcriptional regulator
MESLEPILAKHAFFEGLEPAYLKLLVACASNERFAAGAYICRQGEEASHFYLIRQGRVALEIRAPQRPPIVIETLDGDDILGWSWLIPPYRWRFDARIVEPARAIALDGKCLRAKCEEDHDLGYELLKRFTHIVTQRLHATWMQLLDVYAAART